MLLNVQFTAQYVTTGNSKWWKKGLILNLGKGHCLLLLEWDTKLSLLHCVHLFMSKNEYQKIFTIWIIWQHSFKDIFLFKRRKYCILLSLSVVDYRYAIYSRAESRFLFLKFLVSYGVVLYNIMFWAFTSYVHCIFYCSHRHQVALTQTAMLQGKYCKAVILSFHSQYINLPWSLLKKELHQFALQLQCFSCFVI